VNTVGHIPVVRIGEAGEWLEWNPWSEDPSDWVEGVDDRPSGDDGGEGADLVYAPNGIVLLDEFAALARPARWSAVQARILEIARSYGPLSWCSACGRLHQLAWRMTAPPPIRGGTRMRELLIDWVTTAAHVNALRRLMADLRTGHGRLDDWNIVWPDRPISSIVSGPDPGLDESDPVERLLQSPFGDVVWERRQVARHLTSWLASCHVGRVTRWDDDEPRSVAGSGSLLGVVGDLLDRALVGHERIRVCTGSVRGLPCRVTETVVRDKPRNAPALCEPCYALYRQTLPRSHGGRT
jgi:hypothetical protein